MFYPGTTISPPYHGDIQTVEAYLSEGKEVQGCDIQRCIWGVCFHDGTVKSFAMTAPSLLGGHIATLRLLLDHYKGATADEEVNRGLMDACACGKEDLIKVVLQHSLFVDYNLNTAPASAPRTFLGAAAYGLHVNAIELLLSAGADVNFKGPLGRSPFMTACMAADASNHKVAVLKLLLAHGADVSSTDYQGKCGYQQLQRWKHHSALQFVEGHCQSLVRAAREALEWALDPDSLQILLGYFMNKCG